MAEKKRDPDAGDESVEELLNRLDNHLRTIETDEILGAMTPEELEQRNFIGKKPIKIDRSKHKETTEKEKLVLEPGVGFRRLADSTRFEDIHIESLIGIDDVAKGQLIATRGANERVEFTNGHNVKKEIVEGREHYLAEAKGKAVIIKSALFIFPSDIDCTIAVRISGDKMSAFMDCEMGYGEGRQLSLSAVLDEMRNAGIRHGTDEEAIVRAVNDAIERRSIRKDIRIARGKAPVAGKNGRIDLKFDLQAEETFRVLPDGRVDYKNTSLIRTVRKGGLLAEIVDPLEGLPGANVLGETVPAESGKPATLVGGRGVSTSGDGKSFFAETDGCIVLNEPIIEILDVYVINGDVDYSSGNIEFSGNVIVNGAVREGFEVNAEGDVIVAKNVEPSVIKAGRDVRVMGGIQGKGKGVVSAGRDIVTEYAQNATLEAQGNIYIHDFAVNSRVYTCKCLSLQEKHGTLVGGEGHAQLGVDTKVLGSPAGTKTYVFAGTDFLVKRKLGEVDKAIQFAEENIAKIETALKPLLKRFQDSPASLKNKKDIIEKSLEKRDQLKDNRKIMLAKKKQLQSQMNTDESPLIKVSQICYPDVFLKIRDARLTVTREMSNVRFFEDQKDGTISTGAC